MKEDRKLKFSHNYFSPQDTKFTDRESRLIITSGLKPEFAKVVTDRVHNLLTSGVWAFWDYAEQKWGTRESKLSRVGVPPFASLALQHDCVYLLLIVTGLLFAACSLCFMMELELAISMARLLVCLVE